MLWLFRGSSVCVAWASSLAQRPRCTTIFSQEGSLSGSTLSVADLPSSLRRSDKVKGFQVVPKRWVVERTFGWLGRYRRLSKDYEELTENSEAMIVVCMIHRMLRHLKPAELAAEWKT